MATARHHCILSACLVIAVFFLVVDLRLHAQVAAPATRQLTIENRPWTRWWWLGNIVTKQGITEQLQAFRDAGLGGVEITPLYGVKGQEQNSIDFLSPKWIEMLSHTAKEAERLRLGVDMITGTGWPFGGPNIPPELAAKRLFFEHYELMAGEKLPEAIACKDERLEGEAELIGLTLSRLWFGSIRGRLKRISDLATIEKKRLNVY